MATTQSSRKPVESRRALQHRQKTLALGIFLALGITGALAMLLIGCGSGTSAPVAPPVPAVQALQAADVQNIVQAAVNSVNADMAVMVVDRAGFVLGVFRTQSAPATAVGNFGLLQNANDVAVALARTGAFFSNDQAPLSSRTVRFISGIHFPPGVMNQPPADLYGIENTNRGCTLVNDSIFYKNVVVGGIGVVTTSSNLNVAEFAAFSGSTTQRGAAGDNFGPTPAAPGVVFIGGIALPFVDQTSRPSGFSAGPVTGTGSFLVAPTNSQEQPPEGDLIAPVAGPLGGLSASDVAQILNNAEATANTTRAAIRLPLGSRARMVIAVADLDGTIIGLR